MTLWKLGMNCPHCESEKVVKNGHRQGKQSYLCRICNRQFWEHSQPLSYSAEVKDLCVKMSLNGMGFRGLNGWQVSAITAWSIGCAMQQQWFPTKTLKFQKRLKSMNCKLSSVTKKQNLALDGRKYKTAWNCQVHCGRPLPQNLCFTVANDSRMELLFVHHWWLQGLPLPDWRRWSSRQ